MTRIMEIDDKLIWSAVFASEMVLTYRNRQKFEGTAHALKCLPDSIGDAECLANIIVEEYKKYIQEKRKL